MPDHTIPSAPHDILIASHRKVPQFDHDQVQDIEMDISHRFISSDHGLLRQAQNIIFALYDGLCGYRVGYTAVLASHV